MQSWYSASHLVEVLMSLKLFPRWVCFEWELRLRILHSLRPHAAYTLFEVRRRIVLSLILLHVIYGNIVFTGAYSGSQRRLRVVLSYRNIRRRVNHISHLKSTVSGTLLVDNARIQLSSFLYKILFAILLICFLYFILPHHRALATWLFRNIVCFLWVSHLCFGL
jgi:hypothetical protein